MSFAHGVKLVPPGARYRESYIGLVAEFILAEEKLVPFVLEFDHSDFGGFLKRLEDCSRGTGLPEGYVPHSTLWLVRGNEEVLGVSNIRHELTPPLRRDGGHVGYGIRPSARRQGFGAAILKQSLDFAQELGIAPVLVTCGKGNVASAAVIRRNGGILDSEEYIPARSEIIQRYWIEHRLDSALK